MLYNSGDEWRAAKQKRILFFGMSGLGKTYLSNILRDQGRWFHYSVDYRIGTRYIGEHIADNFKKLAMDVPLLRDLLKSDSISINSKIRFENLEPVATYLGKPGDTSKGGLPIELYKQRQEQYKQAEICALQDTPDFITRAQEVYDYPHFICDSGGSICEWVNTELGLDDPLLKTLSENCLLVWLKGDEHHKSELIKRFDRAPKPMSYRPDFLHDMWETYLKTNAISANNVDPDAFIRFTYEKALNHRQPLYENMARFGVTLNADNVSAISTEEDFINQIAKAIDNKA